MKRRKGDPQPTGQISVRGLSAGARRGIVSFKGLRFPCALGRSGRRTGKREGDGATPIGSFKLRKAYYRRDRLGRPRTGLPLSAILRGDGWCDEPADRNYNRPVCHPYAASAEHLWREDHLYDLVVVIACNDVPRVRGRGSAIFMHIAGPDLAPTAGCVALSRPHLLRLMQRMSPRTVIRILP
jgi:L,D-peptidoglycan transpeptidase YkuD (ErfK/YbiS/YcfS/YnhG family)